MENCLGVMRQAPEFFDAAAGTPGSWQLIGSDRTLQVSGFVFDTVDESTPLIEHRGWVTV